MNRLFHRLAPAALALVMIILLGSCSKSGDMDALLKTVPADATFVATANADELLKQLDYKQEGDHATYCKELSDLLRASGLDSKDIAKVTDGIDLTDKVLAMFMKGNDFYLTFSVKDADNFKKWYAGVSREEFQDEGNGFFTAMDGEMVLKDKQVWLCSSKANVSEIEKLLSLSGDESFAGKHSAMADKMCDSKNYFCAWLGIDEALALARKGGAATEAGQLQLALGMAFKDAASLSLVASLDSDKVTGQLSVLNAEGDPAEFLIPLGKINTASMNKVNNDAALVAAVDFSPELMSKLQSLKSQVASTMSGPEAMVLDLLLNLSGTTAVSFNGPTDYIVSVGMKDEKSSRGLGEFISSAPVPVKVSNADKFLIVRSSDTAKSGGSAPKAFSGNFMGLYMNFESSALKAFAPMNLAGMGNVTIVLGPEGKGIMLRSEWKVKNPVKTLLRLYSDWFTQMSAPASASFVEEEEVEIVEPEPDSDIDY